MAIQKPAKNQLQPKDPETLGLGIVTSSVTFIKSVNQRSIKPILNIAVITHT